MSKKQKSVGDFKVCKEEANQFYAIAVWCDDRDAVQFLYETMYPYAVNVAFACELYIKAIQLFESSINEFTKGHNLKELFDGIEESTRNNIKSKFEEVYSGMALEDFLAENGETFVEWRYALENGVRVNISGFEAFSKVLHDYVNALGKEEQ